ncbi:flavodoxin [Oscillospiraceae bacterium CM]|nr:flavodoxin [Oscillospiraceae bacterium CM]
MKSLVVCYSLEGHTASVADIIMKETGGDICLLLPKSSTGKSGFSKYFLGGMRALFHQKPKLLNDMPRLTAYDTIYIGTPIWASRPTPAVNSFLAACDLTAKKVFFFTTSGGGDAGQCLTLLKSRLRGGTVCGTLSLTQEEAANAAIAEGRVKAWLSRT